MPLNFVKENRQFFNYGEYYTPDNSISFYLSQGATNTIRWYLPTKKNIQWPDLFQKNTLTFKI
jgi:hypothetical protein